MKRELAMGDESQARSDDVEAADEVPVSFVVCLSDEAILKANLLASPCLQPGSPPEVIAIRHAPGVENELTNSPGVTYTYDNDGNLITAQTASGTTTYTYDYENRLTNVKVNGTVVATYTYDALGRRIGIKDNGTQTWTVYNGAGADANPYADFNGSGSVTMRYLFGLAVDEILARTDASGKTAWYLTDRLGSVRDLVDTSGNFLDTIVYDPFGHIVTETNASAGDRFKYAGMEYDAATGLDYDHARYYDAAINRFMNPDPLGFAAGDSNLYRYVGNDPTGDVDPSGLLPAQPPPLGAADSPLFPPPGSARFPANSSPAEQGPGPQLPGGSAPPPPPGVSGGSPNFPKKGTGAKPSRPGFPNPGGPGPGGVPGMIRRFSPAGPSAPAQVQYIQSQLASLEAQIAAYKRSHPNINSHQRGV
jgi:RHS repeat-associated protein